MNLFKKAGKPKEIKIKDKKEVKVPKPSKEKDNSRQELKKKKAEMKEEKKNLKQAKKEELKELNSNEHIAEDKTQREGSYFNPDWEDPDKVKEEEKVAEVTPKISKEKKEQTISNSEELEKDNSDLTADERIERAYSVLVSEVMSLPNKQEIGQNIAEHLLMNIYDGEEELLKGKLDTFKTWINNRQLKSETSNRSWEE